MKFAVTSLALIASASAFAPSTTAPVSYSNLNKTRSQTHVAQGEQNCGLELFQTSQYVFSEQGQGHTGAPRSTPVIRTFLGPKDDTLSKISIVHFHVFLT